MTVCWHILAAFRDKNYISIFSTTTYTITTTETMTTTAVLQLLKLTTTTTATANISFLMGPHLKVTLDYVGPRK